MYSPEQHCLEDKVSPQILQSQQLNHVFKRPWTVETRVVKAVNIFFIYLLLIIGICWAAFEGRIKSFSATSVIIAGVPTGLRWIPLELFYALEFMESPSDRLASFREIAPKLWTTRSILLAKLRPVFSVVYAVRILHISRVRDITAVQG
jgi:hypothetical protein